MSLPGVETPIVWPTIIFKGEDGVHYHWSNLSVLVSVLNPTTIALKSRLELTQWRELVCGLRLSRGDNGWFVIRLDALVVA